MCSWTNSLFAPNQICHERSKEDSFLRILNTIHAIDFLKIIYFGAKKKRFIDCILKFGSIKYIMVGSSVLIIQLFLYMIYRNNCMINTDNMYNDKGEARESINFMSTVADCFYLKKKNPSLLGPRLLENAWRGHYWNKSC
jgi:hypothetical protein